MIYLKINELDELQMYVSLLEEINMKVYTDYNEIVKDLKYEYNITTTAEQISKLYQPRLEEDIEDLKLRLQYEGYSGMQFESECNSIN